MNKIELVVLWEREVKGKKYLTGTLNGFTDVLIKKNDSKKNPEDPDYVLHLATQKEINKEMNLVIEYKPSFCELIPTALIIGTPMNKVLEMFGIDMSTFIAWRKKHPEFDQAIKETERHSYEFGYH